MKVALTAINCKYSHTNLAIRYLRRSLEKRSVNVQCAEFNISDNDADVLEQLMGMKADIYAFSCYIWNIDKVLHLSRLVKKLSGAKILLGGPEVSYTAREIMENNSHIDAIIKGEGENIISPAVEMLTEGECVVPCTLWRNGEVIEEGEGMGCADINELELPYSPHENFTNKMIYYESSRGCPFACKYCLSSVMGKLRMKELDKVIADIDVLNGLGAMTVKFVDRTFNADRKRAYEIFKHVIELESNSCFHFEISADLLDEATIELLRTAPAGRIQLEIGVQSTNTDTLNKIDRKNNLDRIASSVTKILEKDNIHIHLDLIAGLPGEGIESFRESYNYCFNLKPHKLQLGFLKVLKGSRLWSESAEHGLVYDDNPPYEVLATRDISYDELRTLHDVEEMTDRVFNERRFARSLEYIGKWINGFDLFLRLAKECRRAGGFQGHREDILFASVYNVGLEIVNDKEFLEECLRYDYLRKRRGSVLDWMKDRQLQGIDRSKLLRELFPNNKGMHKFVHVEGFDYDMAGTRCPQMAIFNYVDGTVTWYDGLIE